MRLKCYLYHGFNIHSGINLIIGIGCDFNITHHLNISSAYYVSFKSILLKYMHLLMAIIFLYLDNAYSKCMPILTYNVVLKTSIQLLLSYKNILSALKEKLYKTLCTYSVNLYLLRPS